MNPESTDCSVKASVKDDREVTMTVKFQRTVTLPDVLTTTQQVEFFTRLAHSGIREILTETMDWAITGEEQ